MKKTGKKSVVQDKKTGKVGKVKNEPSKQENSRLFRIPSPILMEICILFIENPQDLVRISITCKKLMEFVYFDPLPWMSLVIWLYPKVIGTQQVLLGYKEKLKNGYRDTSKNWQVIFKTTYIKAVEIKNHESRQKLTQYFNPKHLKKLETLLKESKKIVIGRNNRSKIEILNKSIKIFDHSMIITISHIHPVSKPTGLDIKVFGSSLTLQPLDYKMIKEGNISLGLNQHALCIIINSEIYTEYLLVSYYNITAELSNYKVPIRRDDISSRHGLIDYKFLIEAHNLTQTFGFISKMTLDFEQINEKAVAWIEDLNIGIPKEKMVINWKSVAFSDKINDVCIFDFILFSEFGDPIFWGASACVLKFEETNSNEGDGYSFSITRDNLLITVYLRDKRKQWKIVSIKIEILLSYVLAIFPKF